MIIGSQLIEMKSFAKYILSNLSNDEKYTFLYHHIELPSILPPSLSCGNNSYFSVFHGLGDIPGYYTVPS